MRNESVAAVEEHEELAPAPSASGRRFEPGVRLSGLDIGVLVATAAGCAWLAVSEALLIAAGIAFVVGHFFLFCNVFRIRRGPELIWAALFTGLSAATIVTEHPGWPITFLASGVATVILVAIEMRHPSYHGLGWAQLNPDLPRYWRERQQG